ncbi:MAG: RNB domain-containing ribonuclease [Candidatus Promineifilaceae bacterium]
MARPMTSPDPPPNSLVVYKGRPARVIGPAGKKVQIELEGGGRPAVRPKDVLLLHPGPLGSLDGLRPAEGELATAWELLAGQTTRLAELAELAYGAFTPAAAWAAWQAVADGLYFSGLPNSIRVYTAEQVAAEAAARQQRQASQLAWAAFLARLRAGEVLAEDEGRLADVVELALGRREGSRVLSALGAAETPQNAHAWLLRLGLWDETVNPYPSRAGLSLDAPEAPAAPLPEEARRDLTALPALAIDDAGSRDPDDALSLEPGRLWVHIADVAALVAPDSPADLQARGRGAKLYLPEGSVHMLPPAVTESLALGLAELSPALSFGLDLDESGRPTRLEVVPSWVRVTRLSYEEAEAHLEEPPLHGLMTLAEANMARRRAAGATFIELPEVKVRVEANEVVIRPLPPLRSRDLVREAMLMAGEAVAQLALAEGLRLPFTLQEPPAADPAFVVTPAEMVGLRRSMKPSQQRAAAGPHAGLGLPAYVQATSPLRRYLDLVVHQQLRAWLAGRRPLDEAGLMARVGAAEAVGGSVRWAERRSNEHWTLVYLRRRPGWQGEAVVVEARGRQHTILLPGLALEAQLHLRQALPADTVVTVALNKVDLPQLEARFRPTY